MKKVRGTGTSYVAILIIVFLVVVLGGRFIFNNTLPKDDRVPIQKVTDNATSSSAQSSSRQQTSTSNPVQSPATSTPKTLSCEEQLKADLAAKKQSFVKGQLLVTFKAEETYQSAKGVLAVYGLVVQNENDSQKSFTTRRLITAAVAPGQEMIKVCQLRNDAHVQYAGLDLYFGIHQ
jgi:hypothetical protein